MLNDRQTQLWCAARLAAGRAQRAKLEAQRTNAAWRMPTLALTAAEHHELWVEQAKANDLWRAAQADTHKANQDLLAALGCDWRVL